MGNQVSVTPALGNSLYQVTLFNGKIYSVDDSFNLRTLNITEDGWDAPIIITPPTSNNTFKFIEFESKLYIYDYAAPDTAALLRLNDTADAVITVCDTPGFFNIIHACVFNGRLYAGAMTGGSQPALIRLDVSGDDWEFVCNVSMQVSSLATLNGKLYVNTYDVGNDAANGFYRLNDEGTALDFLCFFGSGDRPFDGSAFAFNNRLYYGAVYSLYRLNLTENGFETISNNVIFPISYDVYGGKLYIGADSLNRLNDAETGCINLWENNANPTLPGNNFYIRAMAIKGNELFFITDFDLTSLYKYISLNPNPVASRTIGYKNIPITFLAVPYSDFFPINGFSWDFGDGTVSSDQTVTHSYLNDGTYSVSLTAFDMFDATVTTTRADYVQIIDSTVIYIHNIDELQLIGSSGSYPITAQYQLANNIDAGGTRNWNDGQGFTPITEFNGDFNGAGYKISSLYINRPTEFNTALFQTLNGASFSNLSIDASITSNGNVAVLASVGYGLINITNCSVSGTLTALSSGGATGGIFYGIFDGLLASDCTANIITHVNSGSTGGFSAYTYLANTRPYFFGTGLNGLISNCQITITADGIAGEFGGFSYDVGACYITDCTTVLYGTVAPTGQASNAAGFIGYSVNNTIINCHISGSLNLGNQNSYTTGGFAGYNRHDNGTSFNSCSSDIVLTSSGGDQRTIGGFIGYGFSNLINCHSSGDMDLTGTVADQIGGFCGYSDGPLISCYSTGNIKIICPPSTTFNVGGFVGYRSSGNYPTLNCYSTGNVTTENLGTDIGGFIGYLSAAQLLENCFASGNVSAGIDSQSIGGFAGWMSAMTYHCSATGDVTGSDNVGGFSGVGGNASQCFALGNVFSRRGSTSHSTAGGFAGNGGAIYDNCFAEGNVINDTTDGLKFTGGFIGSCGSSTITNCYSIGRVENIGISFIFLALGQTHTGWNGLAADSSGNIYAVAYQDDIYKQTNGVGDFLSLDQGAGARHSITVAPNGDVYFVEWNGDIFKQTGGVGSFSPLFQGPHFWRGIAAAPNGDVYAVVGDGSGKDIYKQSGGNFLPLSQGELNWNGIAAAPNGDIYAVVDGGDIYKQTGGIGNFLPLGQSSQGWNGIAVSPNGDIYATVAWVDIFKRTNGAEDFLPLNQGIRNWFGTAVAPNGGVYVAESDGDIYKGSNTSGSVGGLIGFSSPDATIISSYWDIETSKQTDSSGGVGKTTAEMQIKPTYVNWDFTSLWQLRDSTV